MKYPQKSSFRKLSINRHSREGGNLFIALFKLHAITRIIVYFSLLLFPFSANAQECDCENQAVNKATASESILFVGTATENQKLRENGYATVFDVKAAWGGFAVYTDMARARPYDGDPCFYPFQVGKTYLIYGTNARKKQFNANACGQTREISSLEEIINELGPPKERD